MAVKNCFRLAACLCLCLLGQVVHAQKKWREKVIQDTSYIRSYYDQWCLTAFSGGNNSLFNIISFRNEHSLTYQTDLPLSAGVNVDYKWFTLGFSSNITYINLHNKQESKGISAHRSLQAGITGKRLWLQASLQEYDGFYLIDIGGPAKGTLGDSQPRTDASLRAFFSSVQYVFNPRRYSHVATLWQLDRQLKSAGTPTMGLLINYYETSADSSLIPLRVQYAFPKEGARSRRTYFNIFVTSGYTYTFALPHSLFFNVGAWMGVGMQRSMGDPSPADVAFSLDANVALGYNGDTFYTGVNVNGKAFIDNMISGEAYNHVFGQARVFVGYRLPKKR